MIRFDRLKEVIYELGPRGHILASLRDEPTSQALVATIANRCVLDISRSEEHEHFDFYVVKDLTERAARIPSPFSFVCFGKSAFGSIETVQKVVDTITDLLEQFDIYKRPIFAISEESIDKFLSTLDTTSHSLIHYTLEQCVEILLTSPHRTRLWRDLLQKTPLQWLNPFQYKGPVPVDRFCGREGLIHQLCKSSQSYALVGPRAVGKTSLIKKAIHDLVADGKAIVVPTECTERMSERDFCMQVIRHVVEFYDLSESIKKRPSFNQLEWLFFDLHRRRQQPVLLFIDEADALIDSAPAVLDFLRKMHDQDKARCIFVGYKSLRRAMSDVKRSPIQNVATELFVPPFSLKECRELVATSMAKLSITLENDQQILEVLLTMTGGSPSRIQLICHFLVEKMATTGSRVLLVEEVKSAMDLMQVHKVLKEWYAYSTSDIEKWLAVVAGDLLPCSEDRLVDAARRDLPGISPGQVEREIQDLITANVFSRSSGSPLMLEFAFPKMKQLAFDEVKHGDTIQSLRDKARVLVG